MRLARSFLVLTLSESMIWRSRLLLLLLLLPFPAQSAGPYLLWFNSGFNNRDVTFTPDGNRVLSTILMPRNLSATIITSTYVDGIWNPAEVASFSGQYADIEPMFTPDGSALYFASQRPKPDREGNDWDIWRVDYRNGVFSDPVNLGAPINTPGNEFYPSIAANGNLYFTATRADSKGHEDIYMAKPEGDGYSEPVSLGTGVNSAVYEFNAFIAPDESYLIFGSQGREGELGGGDLYVSYRGEDGSFQPATLLPRINSPRLDYSPMVFRNKLYYTSERKGPMDVSTITKIIELHSTPGNGLGDVYMIDLNQVMPKE